MEHAQDVVGEPHRLRVHGLGQLQLHLGAGQRMLPADGDANPHDDPPSLLYGLWP